MLRPVTDITSQPLTALGRVPQIRLSLTTVLSGATVPNLRQCQKLCACFPLQVAFLSVLVVLG